MPAGTCTLSTRFLRRRPVPARRAGVGHDLPFAVATGAGDDPHAHAEEALHLLLHLPVSAAGGALGRRGAGLRAVARAGVAHVHALEFQRLVHAGGDLLQGQFDLGLQVHARLGPAMAAGETHVAENVLEHGEDVAEPHVREVMHARAAKPLVPEAVVLLPLDRVAENLVRLGQLLEPGLGLFLVALDVIGVVFQRALAVSALDLVGADIALDAKDLVVISF